VQVNTDLVGFVQKNGWSNGDAGHGCDAGGDREVSALGVMRDMRLPTDQHVVDGTGLVMHTEFRDGNVLLDLSRAGA